MRKPHHASARWGGGESCSASLSLYVDVGFNLFAGDATQADDTQDPVEKAVTLQLGTLLTALSELVQTPLMLGTSSVTLLRGLTRTYGTLTTLAKHVGSERPACLCDGRAHKVFPT